MTTQQLHDLINEKIYENHVGAITATDMNTILNEMVSEEEQIRQTYLPLTGGTITGPLSLRSTLTLPRNIVAIDTDGADELLEIDYTSSPYKVKFGIGYDQLVLRANEIIKYDINWNEYKLLDTGPQIFTNIEKLQVRENIGAVSSSDVDNKINLLDSSITKEASTPENSSAAGSYKKIAVVNGFSLKQTDGKLVDLNALGNPSIVYTVEVDAAGSAQKALFDAKTYADSLLTGVASVFIAEYGVTTEAELIQAFNANKFIIVKDSVGSDYHYYFPHSYRKYTSNNTEKFTGTWVYTHGNVSTVSSYVTSSYIRFRGLNFTGWGKESDWIYGLDEAMGVMSQAEVDALFDEGGGGGGGSSS